MAHEYVYIMNLRLAHKAQPIYIYIHIYTHIHTHIYTHIHTHTHTHTHLNPGAQGQIQHIQPTVAIGSYSI